jgi:hypothetical protein
MEPLCSCPPTPHHSVPGKTALWLASSFNLVNYQFVLYTCQIIVWIKKETKIQSSRVRCKIVTYGTPQGNISILLEGVSDFANLHISRCWALFPTSFYWVNVCLLLVNAKSPSFDQILRKVVECVSNKLLWVLITVVVSTTDGIYMWAAISEIRH